MTRGTRRWWSSTHAFLCGAGRSPLRARIFARSSRSLLRPGMQSLILVANMLMALPPASADDAVMRGSAIAAYRCGKCHAVGVADASPHRTPPLRELAAEYPIPMLVEALKTGTIGGHDEMPQFDLGLDGASALVAYIDSLNPAGPHYLGKPQ